MKKITAILTAAFMFTALIAGSVTAAEDDVTGTWYLQSMVQDGIEVDASILSSLGMEAILEMNGDGTLNLYVNEMDGEINGEATWGDGKIHPLAQDSEQEGMAGSIGEASYELTDGQLVLTQNDTGIVMTFGREAPEKFDTSLAPAIEHPELSDFNGKWDADIYMAFGLPLPIKTIGTDFSLDIADGQVTYTETDYDLENNFAVTGSIDQTFSAELSEDGTLFVDFNGEEVLEKVNPGSSGIRLTLHEDGKITGEIPEVVEAMEAMAAMSSGEENADAEAADEDGASSGADSLSMYIIFTRAE